MKRKVCDVCESQDVIDTDHYFIFHTAPLRNVLYLDYRLKDKVNNANDEYSLCRAHYIEALETVLREVRAGFL